MEHDLFVCLFLLLFLNKTLTKNKKKVFIKTLE